MNSDHVRCLDRRKKMTVECGPLQLKSRPEMIIILLVDRYCARQRLHKALLEEKMDHFFSCVHILFDFYLISNGLRIFRPIRVLQTRSP